MATRLGGSGGSGGGRPPGKPFLLCPPGLQQAVCCDVIDHGKVRVPKFRAPGEFVIQKKGTICWQSIHRMPMPDGRPYLVQRRFTLSAHVKATIRSFLGNWRGRPLTDQEAEDFDLESLVGRNAMILVTHVNKPQRGGVYQEVMMAAPLPKGVPKIVVTDYIRKKDRPVQTVAPNAAAASATAAAPGTPTVEETAYPADWDDVEPGAAAGEPDPGGDWGES